MFSDKKVTAVISVYNEEKTVGNVVSAILDCKIVDEIIVVNDGSTDNTAKILKGLLQENKFEYVEFGRNRGKSYAMTEGVELSKGDIIVFIDADIIGFECKHIKQLLLPLVRGEADMIIGQPCPDRYRKKLNLLKPLELLAGERAVYKKDILPLVERGRTSKYGAETLGILYYKSQNKRMKIEYLWGVTHLIKSQKEQFPHSLKSYSKESAQIFTTITTNYFLVFDVVRNSISKFITEITER
ncbi:MAG: glycosyltransferase [Deltaproteobacteria bacterium]|nr:glycosyltransferase [Deltaproteobacteria bacterium]